MNTVELELKKLAGTHLGKAGDGTLVSPYITPEKHDKTLLVGLPRSLNRGKHGITTADKFIGYEVWHAYEMSFLKQNGMPCTGVLKLNYPASSKSMVESKSLKLYLNSFDLEKFESIEEVERIIQRDLEEVVEGKVEVKLHEAGQARFLKNNLPARFDNVDNLDTEINSYKESPSVLEIRYARSPATMTFHTANLRSNCEITNQKDSGNSFIYMVGKRLPTVESLTKYIISFRDEQIFHENGCEKVYETLYQMYKPVHLLVADIYTRRGGISIHSVRASDKKTLDYKMPQYEDVNLLWEKLPQE